MMRIKSPLLLAGSLFLLTTLIGCTKDPANRFVETWDLSARSTYTESGQTVIDTLQNWQLVLLEEGTGTLQRLDGDIPLFWEYQEADEEIEIRLEEPTNPEISTIVYTFLVQSSGWRQMIWTDERSLNIQSDQGLQIQQNWRFEWTLRR
ncbi:MAG: hypothetical protein AAGH79_03255 [Bacteroidota bacterium]